MNEVRKFSEWVSASELAIRVSVGAEPVRLATYHQAKALDCELHFRNTSKNNLRIFHICGGEFRWNQSDVWLASLSQSIPLTGGPPPRPHGYRVTENDFHSLEPTEEKTFSHVPIYVARWLATGWTPLEGLDGGNGNTFRLYWRYQNYLTKWEGGAMTLDGPTLQLFDGAPIPGIWTGSLEASMEVLLDGLTAPAAPAPRAKWRPRLGGK